MGVLNVRYYTDEELAFNELLKVHQINVAVSYDGLQYHSGKHYDLFSAKISGPLWDDIGAFGGFTYTVRKSVEHRVILEGGLHMAEIIRECRLMELPTAETKSCRNSDLLEILRRWFPDIKIQDVVAILPPSQANIIHELFLDAAVGNLTYSQFKKSYGLGLSDDGVNAMYVDCRSMNEFVSLIPPDIKVELVDAL